jgi:hypothetical protein
LALELIDGLALALVLGIVVGAPLWMVVGTVQVCWQDANDELQLIMQFVVVDVCARRILAPAAAPPVAAANDATTANAIPNPRIDASPVARPGHHNPAESGGEIR